VTAQARDAREARIIAIVHAGAFGQLLGVINHVDV